jgi:hypothetical protein
MLEPLVLFVPPANLSISYTMTGTEYQVDGVRLKAFYTNIRAVSGPGVVSKREFRQRLIYILDSGGTLDSR